MAFSIWIWIFSPSYSHKKQRKDIQTNISFYNKIGLNFSRSLSSTKQPFYNHFWMKLLCRLEGRLVWIERYVWSRIFLMIAEMIHCFLSLTKFYNKISYPKAIQKKDFLKLFSQITIFSDYLIFRGRACQRFSS